MPGCSTCGFGVEMLRSCYQSKWRLFRDSPLETPGRYYFAAPGTPIYPGVHHFGSRTWYDGNHLWLQGLGEVITGSTQWDDGLPPADPPFARLAGDAECIAAGELMANAIPASTLTDGFPDQCFVPLPSPPDLWPLASAFNRCAMQRFYSCIIDWLYADQPDRITEAFHALLGPAVQVRVRVSTSNLPSVCTVIGPKLAIAVHDGTRNFQTLALQAYESFGEPQNFGLFGTELLWMSAAQRTHTFLLADGMLPDCRVFTCGHSYGAAVALILAARYKANNLVATQRYLTFGCPKIGDQRLADLTAQIEGVNLANDNDFVTAIPPDDVTVDLLEFALGNPNILRWKNWKRPGNQVQQNNDGTLEPNAFPLMDFSVLLATTQRLIVGDFVNAFPGHAITEYLRRIELRCPGAAWPVDAEVDVVLKSLGDIRFDAEGKSLMGGVSSFNGGKFFASRGGLKAAGHSRFGSDELFASSGGLLIDGQTVFVHPPIVYLGTCLANALLIDLDPPGPYPGVRVGMPVSEPLTLSPGTVVVAVSFDKVVISLPTLQASGGVSVPYAFGP